KSVTILTPDGWSVTLTQLGSIAVTRGATVAEGDGVGTIGPSGDPEVSGPYIQLGIRHADQEQGYVDPGTLLPSRTIDPGPAAVKPDESSTAPPPSDAVPVPVAAPAAPAPVAAPAAPAAVATPAAAAPVAAPAAPAPVPDPVEQAPAPSVTPPVQPAA